MIAQAPEGPITYGELVNGRSDYFAADVRRALGRRLAGLWITNATVYNIGVVRPTDADRSKVADLARPYGATGVVVPARYTGVELGRFMEAPGADTRKDVATLPLLDGRGSDDQPDRGRPLEA